MTSGIAYFMAVAMTVALLVPASAFSRSRTVERVSAGNVTAELSYVKRRAGRYVTRYRDKRVRITRNGKVVRDERVPKRRCDDSFCTPAQAPGKGKSIRLRDVTGDGEPEVLVDLFTGGAYCCFYTLAYGYQPAGNTYARRARDFGKYAYRLVDLDGNGTLEFKSGDMRFYAAFSCGACGVLPINIWNFDGHRFVNVSRSHPAAVRRHARRLLRAYVRTRSNGIGYVRGYLTPYVGDQCLLRRCRIGFRAVERARRRGELRKRRGDFEIGPYGRDYARKLKRLLERYGYLR